MCRPGLYLLLGCFIGLSSAADRFELAAGKGSEQVDALRLAWQRSWARQWTLGGSGRLAGYHAVSVNHWRNGNESITALGYSPVLTYSHQDSPLYVRFGIGAAWLSDTRIGGRRLGSRFQFEDQIGIGWRDKRHDLGLVYMHYSNGGFDNPNHGIDLVLFSYTLIRD